jgi:hypothetical protein
MTRDYQLKPTSRFTVDAGSEPDLINRSVQPTRRFNIAISGDAAATCLSLPARASAR